MKKYEPFKLSKNKYDPFKSSVSFKKKQKTKKHKIVKLSTSIRIKLWEMTTNHKCDICGKKVFLVLKNDIYYNGVIEKISESFLIISDRKIGMTTMSLDMIKRIEPR